jgi:acyl-CoA synthetase (NDP forming)
LGAPAVIDERAHFLHLNPMPLAALLAPASVAVLGASERPSAGRGIVESLQRIGFAGDVWPVNPRYPAVAGVRCYESVAALPRPPDVVAFCIRSVGILPEMKALAARGAKAAVIYDGGFAELGADGKAMQDEIAAVCREAGIALCGPNCMGVLNPQARSTTFKQNVREPARLAGNVAMISQSGSVAASMLADLRRFGFSLVVSSGNEAVVGTADYLDYAVDDPNTKVIATFTETVREPERYVAALDRAAAKGKPVIVLKVGRSARTHAAIVSHTGGLAGESRVFSEVLRAHRAIEVDDLDELTEVLAAVQGARWPSKRGTNVVTTSGGQAELILDVATAAGLELAPLPAAAKAAVEKDVGRVTGDGNPLDAWGGGAFEVTMPAALKILSENPETESVVFCSSDSADDMALGKEGREEGYATLFAAAAGKSSKPHYFMTMRPGIMNREQVDILRAAGVPVIGGTRQGLGAIEKLATWAMPRQARARRDVVPCPALTAARTTINEHDAKKILAQYGLPVTRETLVTSAATAREAAAAIGYPGVLKAVSDDIPHKSEHGLVAVGLADDASLVAAFNEMARRVAALGKPVQGYLVQEMVADGIEVFAGVARDPDFGLTIAFGLGGTGVEVLRDFSLRVLPLREGDAEDMIAQTRGAALLGAFRGRPATDVAALARCLYALSDFACANAARIEEIDLNPIKARAQGCIIVDALIVTRKV